MPFRVGCGAVLEPEAANAVQSLETARLHHHQRRSGRMAARGPVAAGLVVSCNRPGGNATGVSNYLSDLGAKRLELLHELVPNAAVIGMLVNPNYPDAESQWKDVKEAARIFGQQVHVVNASTESDFHRAFAVLVQLKAGALLVGTDTFFLSRRAQLVLLAVRHAIPAMYFLREFVSAGGLLS